jgi:RHS repeat-associated protein
MTNASRIIWGRSRAPTLAYFVGNYYELTGSVVTKYYYAGSQRIAMRVGGTLSFLMGDHLGSTSLSTDANGTVTSEQRYTAWGEVRFSSSDLPTQYTYTGQYSYTTDFGLLFYNTRWVDPALGRFGQADTDLPASQGVQGYDRYAYVKNDPVALTDPTGHTACSGERADDGPQCFGKTTEEKLRRLNISTEGLNDKEKAAVARASIDIAVRFASMTGATAEYAFNSVFKGALTFKKSSQSCGQDCWGKTNQTTVTIYANANVDSITYNNFLVHEMGHAFDNATGGRLTAGYSARIGEIYSDKWTAMPTGNAGYASPSSLWIQGHHSDGFLEETADMFLGWTYNAWGPDRRRAKWMDLWMPYLLRGSAPDYLTQYNYDEGPAP